MANEQEQLKHLKRKRGAVKGKLTNFITYLDPLQSLFDENKEISKQMIAELKLRLGKCEMLLDEFESVQINIEYACEEVDLTAEYEYRNEFTNLFSAHVARANLIINEYQASSNLETVAPSVKSDISSTHSNEIVGSSSNKLQNIKLPVISLPKFSGNYNYWLEFKDTFDSLIHKNDSINPIQKYHYLRAALEGDAKKIIQSLEFSSRNYETAWDLLCIRYNNSRMLVHNHIKSIFDIEQLHTESSVGLRKLTDNVFKHLRALETLNQPVKQWDTLLIYIMSSKLDKVTSREWEKTKIANEFPTFEEMTNFLQSRAEWLETLEMHSHSYTKRKDNQCGKRQTSLASIVPTCNYCQQSHLIYACSEFLNLTIPERINKVKELQLCANCLCKGHSSKKCRYGSCKKCKAKHNTLIHIDQPAQQLSLHSYVSEKSVLLSTAIIAITDAVGNVQLARALLDSGSMSNFITSNFYNKLQLPKYSTDVSIVGINKLSSQLNYRCDVTINSLCSKFSTNLSCFILPEITGAIPTKNFDIASWNIPTNLQLADPTFNKVGKIDLLIGAGHFWTLLTKEKLHLGENLPMLNNTVLGWILTGTFSEPAHKTYCCMSKTIPCDDLQRFWELEDISTSPSATEDDECESHFRANVNRTSDGRFKVKIPLKYPSTHLGESKTLAIKRFNQLETKFKTNPKFKSQYVKFMSEYINMGHMSKLRNVGDIEYFLPHHGVSREDSITTKLRVVFDGSAPSNSGWSLNDIQHTGPTILNDLVNILLRFRQFPFAVTADIEKMYRQILVDPEDRHLQQIVWRNNENEPLFAYQLNTVTYGTKSAPYLAVRCLKQLALDYQGDFPMASQQISENFYVDDLIASFPTEEEAISVCQQISDILRTAHFPLRKWASNSYTIVRNFEDSSDETSILPLGDNSHVKTLGIMWLNKPDMLTFKYSELDHKRVCKRSILSDAAKLFDPLGIISPCIVIAKIIMQEIWLLKLGWDDDVPENVSKSWLKFKNDLPSLNHLQIKRHVLSNNYVHAELHGFCDASKSAYAACIYMRCVDKYNKVHISLLCAKTKVAPIKQKLTVPRLELCSALLLSRLVKKVTHALTIQCQIYMWCDSQITLCWIQTSSKCLNQFVANRVREIQTITKPTDWKYVNTKENPADIASRGMLPSVLLHSVLWWHGPHWLMFDKSDWPAVHNDINSPLPEMKKQYVALSMIETISFPFQRYSNLIKIKRVMAYCLRFINRNSKGGPLTVSELETSITRLLKIAQHQTFAEEIRLLSQNKPLTKSHKLSPLSPFLDHNGLLRVGGRLKNSELAFDAKHPILISGKHHLTRLIFLDAHKNLLHAGPQLVLATVRRHYWATSGMTTAKAITRNCVTCFKCKPVSLNPIMAHLPQRRVQIASAFYTTGVDYAGPFTIKDRKGRGCKLTKSYICLFVCFTSKAVHIELVPSLTSESFIAALRRFVCRRGKPAHIYSDNGTNFVAANKELIQLQNFLFEKRDEIENHCTGENIQWHFIPPGSPHFGGIWESGIKSTKFHLTRVLNNAKLTFEEFYTVIVQIEATLNSRPLYPLSSDPNDLQPLTPSHFLIGRPITTIPDPNLDEIPINRLARYQLLQQLNQCFWKRWSTEYLCHLQQKYKWTASVTNIPIGTLVLIKNENSPSCHWPLGRVVEVHPGTDGVVRVATLRTTRGVLKRTVHKLCPLPIPEVKEDSTKV